MRPFIPRIPKTALALLAGLSLSPAAFSVFEQYAGNEFFVPDNVVVASGDYFELEAETNILNLGRFEYQAGSRGLLSAGWLIHLRDGFAAREGAKLRGMIDLNHNGISDYVEELDADGDGIFDALEEVLGTSSSQPLEGFEADLDGDGIFDRVYDTATGGTTSQFIPGSYMGYRSRMVSFHQAYGTYYSVSASFGGGLLDTFFSSFFDWFELNFTATYEHFELDYWKLGATFTPEAGRRYLLQGADPVYQQQPDGSYAIVDWVWSDISNEIVGGGVEWTVYSDREAYEIWELPPFVRMLELGEATVTPNSGGFNALEILGLGEVSGNSLKLSLPEVLGVPADVASQIDWGDLRDPGSSTPWLLDLDGDGTSETSLDPLNLEGKTSVKILGQTVDITVDQNGVQVGLGKFKVRRNNDGEMVVDLPGNLLGLGDHSLSLSFSPPDELDLAVDKNRDGFISMSSHIDLTFEDEPYIFWVNNDHDGPDGDDPEGSEPNYQDDQINGIRDLEDFSRLHLKIDLSRLPHLESNLIQAYLRLDRTEGNPSIKIWRAADADGDEDYLEDVSVAQSHLGLQPLGSVADGQRLRLPLSIWNDPDFNGDLYLLFEGSGVGKGSIVLEYEHSNGDLIDRSFSAWLDLRDIQSMYERAVATPSSLPDPYDEINAGDPQVPAIGWAAKPDGFPFKPAWDEDASNRNYIVFVHGWRMSYPGARTFAESFYKRLWHRGYKGRYAFYRWHTYADDSFDMSNPVFDAIEAWLSKYNESEYRAWKYGEGLKGFVESLPNGYEKHIAAHSMGNVVASSAIDNGLNVKSYALLQAAIPATCFDGRSSLYQSPSPGLLGSTYWDDTTPDDHSSSVVRARSYKSQIPATGANLINCYLADDVATQDAWEANNAIFKPVRNGIIGFTDYYSYDENESAPSEVLELVRVYQPPPPFGVQKLREVTDKHENMALLNQSRTKSAGAEFRTAGSINNSIDLNSFGFGDVHSAQFIWEIQRLKGFYNMILREFEADQNLKP